MACTNDSVFNVAVYDAQPYIEVVRGDHVKGSFVDILKKLIKYCCDEGASLNISRITENPRELMTAMDDNVEVLMPYTLMHGFDFDVDNVSTSFVPVLPSPGSILLVDFDREDFDLFTILIMTWKLFLLMFVSCGLAGIVVWFTDHWVNPEEFPSSFFRGFWEGYWWAFVSMTTVGYGDSKPKSFIGRVFAMMWIITGISLFAMFTATLTTALNSESETRSTLQGRKVAVLNGSEEHHLAMLVGATPFVFNTLYLLSRGVEDDEVEDILNGILLDYIYMPDIYEIFKGDQLKITKEIPMPRVHGIVFQNLDENLIRCFHRRMKKERYSIFAEDPMYMRDKQKKMQVDGSETISSWLGINSIHLAIYGACVVILFLIFVMWELVYNRKKQKTSISAKRQTSQMTSEVAPNRAIPYKSNLQSPCEAET